MVFSKRLIALMMILSQLFVAQAYAHSLAALYPSVTNALVSANDLGPGSSQGLSSSTPPFEHCHFQGRHFQAEVHYRLDQTSGKAVPIQVIINKYTGPQLRRHQVVFVFASTSGARPGFTEGQTAEGSFNGQRARLTAQFNRDGTLRRLVQHNWNTVADQRYLQLSCFEVQLPDRTLYRRDADSFSRPSYQAP